MKPSFHALALVLALLSQGCSGPGKSPKKKAPPGAFKLARLLDSHPPFPKTLHGKFLVSATVDNRAVLRDLEKEREKVRVLAEFRDIDRMPKQGSQLVVEPDAGFEVLEISRASDGEVNITVREKPR